MKRVEGIIEHEATENALRESKTLTDAVIDNIPLMIFLKEAKDLRFVIFNRAGEELLGYNRKDLLGKNNLDLFPTKEAANFMAKDRETLNSKAGFVDIPEEPITTAKKGVRILHTRKVCIKGIDGNTKYLLGISEDITERKKIEEALKGSEEKYRAILNCSTDQIFIIDKNLKFVSVNSFVARAFGKKPEDIINKPLKNFFHRPSELARFTNNIKKTLRGESQNIEEEIILQGKKGFISTQLNPIKNSSGAVVAVLGIARDITDRKDAEKELKKSQESLQSKVDELEKFNKLAIGRELRMIELKNKIKELEGKFSA